jgi:Ribbon-helix-helix protein, copG family
MDIMDRYAAENQVSRSEAIRRLVELGLKAAPAAKGKP